jgi:hypothetical protein
VPSRPQNPPNGDSGFFANNERSFSQGWPYKVERASSLASNPKTQPGRSRYLAIAIAIAAFVLLGLALFGCATRYAAAPSSAAVQTAITSTETHIDQAAQQNVDARTTAQRIHDKDMLIDRWRETHTKP